MLNVCIIEQQLLDNTKVKKNHMVIEKHCRRCGKTISLDDDTCKECRITELE